MYLFQVALAPALFCFSPLSSGELFSLFPSSLRLGELISFSRCRVLMREMERKWREIRVMHSVVDRTQKKGTRIERRSTRKMAGGERRT